MYLAKELMAWIIDSRPLNGLTNAVLIRLALRVALEDVVTHTTHAAPRKTLKVVIAHIELGLVTVEAGPRIDTRVARATESRIDAVIVRFTEDLSRPFCRRRWRLPRVIRPKVLHKLLVTLLEEWIESGARIWCRCVGGLSRRSYG